MGIRKEVRRAAKMEAGRQAGHGKFPSSLQNNKAPLSMLRSPDVIHLQQAILYTRPFQLHFRRTTSLRK